MGHHGWQGNPPGTEDEARRRIVDAATACLDRAGLAKTSLSDVAAEAGVTRQTVYRYFPSLNDILRAVALAGVEEFAGRMERHLASFGSRGRGRRGIGGVRGPDAARRAAPGSAPAGGRSRLLHRSG